MKAKDFPKLVHIRRDVERRRQLFSKPDLTYLFWECTLKCNLKCVHCGSSCEARSPLEELTTDQIFEILDTIAEDFDPCRIFVSITGGEPLMRKDLFQVVDRMHRLGMRACIVTNGVLLGRKQASLLAEAGMNTITISVDGLKAEHEAMRGEATYDKALAAIGHCRAVGMDVVEAITCVRPANLESLPRVEEAVRAAGATHYRVITIDRMGRVSGEPDPELWMEPHHIKRLFEYVESGRQEVPGDDSGVRFSCGGFLGVDRELSVRPEMGQCYAGLCVGSILADGQVSACPSLPRSWAQGSALERRFSEIWHQEFKAFRDLQWRKEGHCKGCSWFHICLGGGLHERLVQPGDFCWLDRQGI